jgi:TetR/AcrR family transcriptional regulator
MATRSAQTAARQPRGAAAVAKSAKAATRQPRRAATIAKSTQTTTRQPRRAATATSTDSANGHRKQAIVDAAIREFSTKGFAGARINTIARKAKVNKQLIYYYFDSKVGLYEAVLGHLIGRWDERMTVGDPHPSVTVAVKAHTDRLLGQGGVEWIRFWLWEALQATSHGRDVDRARVWARWVTMFEHAQKNGEISKNYDAKMIALTLNSIIVTPYMTPLITKLITGMDPNSDSFKKKQASLLRNLVKAIAP